MEGAGAIDEGLRSVIIRTPDQRVSDLEVTCQPKWTVANLKQHLSLQYPGNPAEDKQRLILAGKLLQDKTQLEELFKSYEYRPIIHFVCTQTLPEPVSDTESTTIRSSRSSVSSPANPPADQNAAPARPTFQIPGGNPRWSAHMNQLHMWRQQLEENQAAFYHQHHLTQAGQAILRRAAEQAQERAAPPPQQQQQQPQQQQQQPVQPAAAQDPEEQHDLLDVFYLIIRSLFLLALAWNYASPAKFCFMGVLLFYLYLYQSGFIELPAFFSRNQNQQTQEDAEEREISGLSILKNALLSFFTSLMPSNENVN